jgi:hypothetical protein
MSYASPPPPQFPGFAPQTIGQILDRIFALFRTNFLLFLKIACAPAAAMFLLYGLIGLALFASGVLVVPPRPLDPLKFMALVPVGLVVGVAFMAVYAIFEAAASHAALQANAGIRVTFRAAYAVAWKNAGRFVWLMILRYLWVGLPILVCYAIVAGVALALTAGAGKAHPGVYFAVFPLMLLAYGGAMVYAIFMSIRLSLAPPACLAEQLPATAALKRSLHLTRHAKGRIFVVMLVVYAAGYAAFLVFEAFCFAVIAAALFLGTVMHLHLNEPLTAIAIAAAVVFVFGAMFLWMAAIAACYAIGFAVLYHDQRLRIEGVPPLPPTGEPA